MADEGTAVELGMGIGADVSHLRHGEKFRHGVNGSGRAPAVDLVEMRVTWRAKSEVSNTWWSIVTVLRLDEAIGSWWEAVAVCQPELIQGFGVTIGGDKLGSRIVVCLYPAAWLGVVNADFVVVEDRVVGRLGPLLAQLRL